MEPSIRTHDKLFEQLLLGFGIAGAVIIILAIVVIILVTRDRRY